MRKRWLIFLLLIIGIGAYIVPVQSGFVLTDQVGKRDYFFPDDSRQITIGWRHSVEQTPRKETYYVDKRGNLSLQSTIYQAYGAGTPDVEGIVDVLYNGFVRVTGIERVIPYYSLYYVPHSHYYIELNNNTYSLSEYVSDDTTVEIHYTNRSIVEWMCSYIKASY